MNGIDYFKKFSEYEWNDFLALIEDNFEEDIDLEYLFKINYKKCLIELDNILIQMDEHSAFWIENKKSEKSGIKSLNKAIENWDFDFRDQMNSDFIDIVEVMLDE